MYYDKEYDVIFYENEILWCSMYTTRKRTYTKYAFTREQNKQKINQNNDHKLI